MLGISNSYKVYEWLLYLSIGVSALSVAALGYFLNHKKRIIIRNEETGKVIQKSPSHTLFFIPIEYWALITPLIIGWALWEGQKNDAQYLSYIESVTVNDVYLVDFTEIYEGADAEYKYGVMKVLEVNDAEIIMAMSDMAYNQKSGPRIDITDGKTRSQSYYADETDTFTKDELLILREKGAIDSVYRH